MNQRFFVTVAKGLEGVLMEELRGLPLSQKETLKQGRGGIELSGNLEDAYRICLWSRVASRVLAPIHEFFAPTPEKLYGGVKTIRWSEHLTSDDTLAVDFVSTESQITHGLFGAQKTKDAIVDQLMSVQGKRPSVDLKNPDVRISVYLHRDQATVSIDLSGESLHRRGYREDGVQGEAPLKETLAAGLLLLSGWPKLLASGQKVAFVDLMCGSGTLLIEAAWIAARIAPGSLRRRFGFQGWRKHDEATWKKLQTEAIAQEITDDAALPQIYGYDSDLRAIRLARATVENAGVQNQVHLERRALTDWFLPAAPTGPEATSPGRISRVLAPSASSATTEVGLVGCNPPYGERLGSEEELIPVYQEIGDLFKKRFQGWNGFVFTGSPMLSKVIGLKPEQRIPLFNGPIESRLLTYSMWTGRAHSTN